MSKQTGEPRYVGTNWDKVQVEAKKGANGSTARKVITRGTHNIALGEVIAETIAKLRQGFEVRFTDGNGEDAVRFYPCVAKGTNHMETCSRTMGAFKAVLNDKTVERQNSDGTRSAVADKGDDDEDGAEGVTPDVMMTCEVCGHRQRVGRKRG